MVLLVLPGVVSPGLAIQARHVGEPATRQLLLGVDGLPRPEVMERRTKNLRGVQRVRLGVAVGVPTAVGRVRLVWMEGRTCGSAWVRMGGFVAEVLGCTPNPVGYGGRRWLDAGGHGRGRLVEVRLCQLAIRLA